MAATGSLRSLRRGGQHGAVAGIDHAAASWVRLGPVMRAPSFDLPTSLLALGAVSTVALAGCNLIFGVTAGSLSGPGGSGGAGTGGASSASTGGASSASTGGASSTGSSGTGGSCTARGTATCEGTILQACDSTGQAKSTDCGAKAACDAPNQRCNDAAPYGRLAVGGADVCVIDDSRNLQCWGENDGLVWTDTRPSIPAAEKVPTLTGVRQVSLGSVPIVLLDDGTVWGWTHADYGELGTTGSTLTPAAISGISATAVEVGAAQRCSCARLVTGAVECWGAHGIGCLGDGTPASPTPAFEAVPTAIPGVTNAVQISIGTNEEPSCAREASGAVLCWTSYFPPVAITGVTDAIDVSVGIYTVFIRTTTDVLWSRVKEDNSGFTTATSYGITVPVTQMASNNSFVALTKAGQLLWEALDADKAPIGPTAITGQPPGMVAEIASGLGGSYDSPLQCLRLALPSIVPAVYCWGDDASGALGIGSPENLGVATAVPNISNVTSLEAAQQATTVVLATGSASFWGQTSAFSQLQQNTPQSIGFLGTDNLRVRTMDTAFDAYALKKGGALGFSYDAALAPGQDLLLAPTGTTFLDAIPCGDWDIGLTTGGSVLVFASADRGTSTASAANGGGIFGNGQTTATANQIFTVPGITSATALAAYCDDYNPEPAHACALASGAVSCWGSNGSGESGSGIVGSMPVSVTAVTVTGETFVSVAVGEYFSCAAATSGKVYCWGYDADGELGNGPGQPSSTPVQVDEITNAVGVTARFAHACAWLADGTMKCWGANDARQLGNGSAMTPSAPVTVQGPSGPLTGVVRASAGSTHTCALLTGGNVACWGSCYYGQCGTGASGIFTTPQQVQGLVSP